MTAAHRNYSELMDDVVQAMSGIFSDVADIENTLSNRLMPVFGDKIFIRDNALWWNAASVNNTQMHPKVVQQFSEFGLSEVQGCPLGIKRAATLDQQEAPVDCVFPVYDAVEAFENSILFRNDLDNGCMATDNGQDHLSKSTCDGSITKHTVDRIKEFTEHVHRATFGLELPVVQAGQTINTRVASGSRVSWIDGVLPFYAASDRGNEHVHDGDYLGYVLDNEARCKDSYKGKSLSQYACYLDSTGTVQLVVPWLGKNYSFLRAGNRLKILEYNFGDQGRDIPEQELFRVEMGTDMCLAPDRQTRVPCTATACIDEEYKTFQDATAFCASSNFADPYYRSEVPKKSNRIYVERLHQEQNLYNPDAPFSQCNIKFTPRDEEHARGKQCTHMQAPIGYSPSAVRLAVKGVSSLNRTRVQIAAARIVRHEFSASPTPVGHASLWAGEQLSLENTVEAVSLTVFALCASVSLPQEMSISACTCVCTLLASLVYTCVYAHASCEAGIWAAGGEAQTAGPGTHYATDWCRRQLCRQRRPSQARCWQPKCRLGVADAPDSARRHGRNSPQSALHQRMSRRWNLSQQALVVSFRAGVALW